jgi:hypothetical protein
MDLFLELLERELDARLAGSGIMPMVYDDENAYMVKYSLPDEFVLTYRIGKEEQVLREVLDATEKVMKFKDLYEDGALDVNTCYAFHELPGVLEFVDPQADVKVLRLVGTILHQRYGRHNIFSIRMDPECIRVDARGGHFYFRYDSFSRSMKTEMEMMDKMMRKPIRKRNR